MRSRHKSKSAGGVVNGPADTYAGYKKGGADGYRAALIEGSPGPKRHDRPGRRYGGSVGADSAPLSQASIITPPMLKKGGWIAGAIRHPGALRKSLHVPEGENIPADKLAKAADSSNPTLAKRARLAETLKKMR